MTQIGEIELIRESFVAVINEMRANVIHASFSSIIYEGRDFSCALLTDDGRLLAHSLDDNPIHIFPVPYSANEIIQKYGADIGDGDLFLHNDPYSGGTHLNDILLLEPIFVERQLLAFAAVRCHWGDVGGMTAGSISGRATEIFQEGVRIPPIRIAARGVLNQEITTLLLANMRVPNERRGDLDTMIGAAHKAADHVGKLARRFGHDNLVRGIDTLIKNSEIVMRQKIKACRSGVYCAEGYVESNGHTDEPLVARLRLTIRDDAVDIDFFDASPQTAGPTNVGPAMVINSAGTILKAFLDPDTPMNHGSFQPISVSAPEGTFINARPPVACGGSVEVKALLDALIAGALGQAIPEKMVGDLKGSGNHVCISGRTSAARGKSFYLFYEYPSGGTGATMRGDGSHATRTYTEGDFNSIGSVEVIESETSMRVERTSIREGSHGHGKFRGGCGLTRDVRILEEAASLSVLSDKNIIPPYGVAGALSGKGNRFVVIRDGVEVAASPIPGKIAGFALRPGDLVRLESAGGGGCGAPLERDPHLVASDLRQGYTHANDAANVYGVTIGANGTVDEAATRARRAELRRDVAWVTVEQKPEDDYRGARRIFVVSTKLATELDVAAGALCELVNPRGPNLRGWISVDERPAAADRLALGPFGRAVLNCGEGGKFQLNPITKGAGTVSGACVASRTG